MISIRHVLLVPHFDVFPHWNAPYGSGAWGILAFDYLILHRPFSPQPLALEVARHQRSSKYKYEPIPKDTPHELFNVFLLHFLGLPIYARVLVPQCLLRGLSVPVPLIVVVLLVG